MRKFIEEVRIEYRKKIAERRLVRDWYYFQEHKHDPGFWK